MSFYDDFTLTKVDVPITRIERFSPAEQSRLRAGVERDDASLDTFGDPYPIWRVRLIVEANVAWFERNPFSESQLDALRAKVERARKINEIEKT